MAMKKAEREALQREQLEAKKAFEQEITGGKYKFIAVNDSNTVTDTVFLWYLDRELPIEIYLCPVAYSASVNICEFLHS